MNLNRDWKNYAGISFLSTTYRTASSIFLSRLTPVNVDYQYAS
jgi:hypothetical protein